MLVVELMGVAVLVMLVIVAVPRKRLRLPLLIALFLLATLLRLYCHNQPVMSLQGATDIETTFHQGEPGDDEAGVPEGRVPINPYDCPDPRNCTPPSMRLDAGSP